MKDVEVSNLRPGMVLAEDIKFDTGILKLTSGVTLNPYTIRRIRLTDIKSVKIKEIQYDVVPCISQDIIKRWKEPFTNLFQKLYGCEMDEVSNTAISTTWSIYKYCSMQILNHIKNSGDNKIIIPICSDDVDVTIHHSLVVGSLCGLISSCLGESDECIISAIQAGLLHDIGKAFISPDIIGKKDSLTDDEYRTVCQHPILGVNYLSTVKRVNNVRVLEAVLLHHERLDGNGYPNGLATADIPILAQIVAVADSCDAICNKRSYKEPMSPEDMSRELQESGTLNRYLISKLCSKLNSYYEGLGVHLNDGSSGYIVKSNGTDRPIIKLVEPDNVVVDLLDIDSKKLNIIDTFSNLYSFDYVGLPCDV